MSTEKIGNVVLDLSLYQGSDLYSDGCVEDELLETVKTHEEKDFASVISEKKSWPFLYHLSFLRGNIIEWLPELENANVLEIGSGCGAVTPHIAKKAKKVTCVELSKKRSLINAYRNKNSDNIEIKVGNFQDIEKTLTEKYDVITLIGVLEYAQSYIAGSNPYSLFLEMLKTHLSENGKIVIAIENKLGLKYWAGCVEDHIGTFFSGIEGYNSEDCAKTFSRKELEKLFRECGFCSYKFYYPYPDYKLPAVIYTDEHLPKLGELRRNLSNFDNERLKLFDEDKAFDNIIKCGLFPEFSNSFLIVLNMEGEC